MLDHTQASSLRYNWYYQICVFYPGYVYMALAHSFISVISNERKCSRFMENCRFMHQRYKILKNNPELIPFLSAKFPFVFVDEFQDTNPIQTAIIEWIEEAGSKVGVIGDVAQSIYGFQGAEPSQFENFESKNQQNYVIKGNRRSSEDIIRFLNKMRTDMNQNRTREENPNIPIFAIAGSNQKENLDKVVDHVKSQMGLSMSEIKILARSNELVTQIKRELGVTPTNTWSNFSISDSTSGRYRFFYNLFSGYQYADQNKFEEGIKSIVKSLAKLGF